MDISDLFISIYHNEKENVRNILLSNPDFIEKILTSKETDERTILNQKFIGGCADFNGKLPSYTQDTPFLFAARNGCLDICNMLLDEFNANIKAINIYGHNAPMWALDNPSNKNIETAISLIKRDGIDLKWLNYGKFDIFGCFVRNPRLSYASNSGSELTYDCIQKFIDLLLDLNFDINAPQGEYGESLLILAGSSFNWIIAFYLILKGADYSFEFEKFGVKHSLISQLCYIQYIPPQGKEQLLESIEKMCSMVGYKYGKIKKPEHLYLNVVTGKPMEFDSERFGV